MEIITSVTNSRVKAIKALSGSKSQRDSTEQYIAEGFNLIKDLPRALVDSYVLTPIACDNYLACLHGGVPYIVVAENVMKSLSDTVTPSGVMAVVNKCSSVIDRTAMAVVLDNIRDPGNLGTIVRTMVACGVKNLIIFGECADVYSPKVVRATMGGVTKLNIAYADSTKDIGYDKLIILDMAGDNIFDQGMSEYRRGVAVVVGNESRGVSPEIRAAAWKKLSLPMSGEMESLNAAVSLSVVLYQIVFGK